MLFENPIFIGGCPRSGTTMLGAMLGAHDECLATPESEFKTDLMGALERGTVPVKARAIRAFLNNSWRFRLWGIEPPEVELVDSSAGGAVARCCWSAAARYGSFQGLGSAKRWVDHTPSNIRWARTLLAVFPGARFLHMVRDGRAVMASVLPLDWGPSDPLSAARWWLSELSMGLLAETGLPSDRIKRVSYEDLVSKPEETLRWISEFLEMPFQRSTLKPTGFSVPSYTQGQHRLIGVNLDPSRLDAWMTNLTDRQIEVFEYVAGDTLGYLGYESRFGIRARPPTWQDLFIFRLGAVRRFFTDRVRRRRRRSLGPGE